MSAGFWTALVALAAAALYLPSLGFGFVYDSFSQVVIDDFVHRPGAVWEVVTLRVLGMDVLDFNRPVNLLALMADSRLWGTAPGGYHLTNLLLHAATAALLFRWLFTLVGRLLPALIAALFFAFHPLHCETVVEIGYREDLLATLFLVAGLYSAFFFEPGRRGRTVLPALGTLGFLSLSIGSKESGIAGFPALAVFWLLFRREPGDRGRQGAWLLLLAAAGALCGGFLAARFALEPRNSIIFTTPPAPIAGSWPEILAIQCRIWAAEFLRILWPSDLCADYTGYSIRGIAFWPALAGVAAVAGLQTCFGWRNRVFALGVAVFWFSLLPVSNFIPIYRPMADRFLYMPMTGVALMLAVLLAGGKEGARPGARLRWASVAAACAVLAGLATRTFAEEQVWRDDLVLWKETARRNPTSVSAWSNLGGAYYDRHEFSASLEPFYQAIRQTNGKYASPLAGLALSQEALGRHDIAVKALEAAVAADPRYARPESLTEALTLPASQAARLKVIALRSKNL